MNITVSKPASGKSQNRQVSWKAVFATAREVAGAPGSKDSPGMISGFVGRWRKAQHEPAEIIAALEASRGMERPALYAAAILKGGGDKPVKSEPDGSDGWEQRVHAIRLADLDRLIEIRWKGRVPAHRAGFVAYLAATFLAWIFPANEIQAETILFCAGRLTGFTSDEIALQCKTVIEHAKAAERGDVSLHEGEERDPRYFYKSATIADDLHVHVEEAEALGLRSIAPLALKTKREKLRTARQGNLDKLRDQLRDAVERDPGLLGEPPREVMGCADDREYRETYSPAERKIIRDELGLSGGATAIFRRMKRTKNYAPAGATTGHTATQKENEND